MKRLLAIGVIFSLLAGCKTTGGGLDVGMVTTTASAAAKAARPISDEEEYYVGRAVAARILATYTLLNDQRTTNYVNLIGQTVALHSDKPVTFGGYHFAVLDSAEVNAFAAPGGIVFITKGMLRAVRNEDELAAVLAHEVAHVNHRDGISAIQKSRWTQALSIIGTEAAKRYGPQELATLVSVFEGSIEDVFKTLVVNGYSKSQEYKADETSLEFLQRAGYNPKALGDFLERLAREGKGSKGGMLKTHPATADRISNVKDNTPRGKADPSSLQARAKRFRGFVP